MSNLHGGTVSRPLFTAVDHVSRTVPDLDAAVSFYVEVFAASELFRIGPIDAADLPPDPQGRDWMERHVGVKGARLTLAMLRLTPNLKLQLVQYDKPCDRRREPPRNCDLGGHHIAFEVADADAAAAYLLSKGCEVLDTIAMDVGPLAGTKNLYVRDPWGLQLELVTASRDCQALP
jgi:catechol 2,3-dioxygenase-like lactoylglutathione lyase family enzyme